MAYSPKTRLHVAVNSTTNAFSGIVQADGSITFANESSALTSRVFAATAAVRDGWYVIGGGVQVEHAVTTRGMATLPAFVADGALPASRTFTTGARVGNMLLVMGGQAGSGDSATLDIAPIAANGTLGTWATSTTTTLPTPLAAPAAIALGDWLYAIGGRISASSTYVDTVSRAPIK